VANKYHAQRTWSELAQRYFDSKAEARRGEELELLARAGEIQGLVYQVTYELNRRPKVTITIDFAYYEKGKLILEDVKGVITRDFRTKMIWAKQRFGIEIRLTRQS